MKKIFNKKNTVYIIIFIFFWFLFILSPISGDDWGNYLIGKQGIYKWFSVAVGMYFDWEGRLFSRILINCLTYNKWLWNIINSLLITFIIYTINKITNKKNKLVPFLLSILTIFLMNIYMFSQVGVWLAGNITYLFPLALTLFYVYYLMNNCKVKYNKWTIVVLGIFNIILPMFVEHMAGLLILINLFMLINRSISNKKLDKIFLVFLILSVASTLIMFLSPGSYKRSLIENVEFNNLSLFGKIFYNIPNFITHTFIINSFLIFLLSFSSVYLILKNKIKKYIKVLLILFLSIIPLLTIIIYNLNSFLGTNYLSFITNSSSIFIISYWIIFILIFLYLLLQEKDYSSILFILMGLILNCIMLLSPTWGTRTTFGTYIFMIIPCIKIISKIKFSRIFEYGLVIFTVLCALVYFVFYINIRLEQNNLEKSIKKQLKENKEVIEIRSFPNYANCNINPYGEFHMGKFKEYYNIPEDKEVILLPNDWRFIFIR